MKVLFLMSHAGQARNFESTVRGLAERGHEVHMGFDRLEKRNLPGLSDLAETLVEEYYGVTSGPVPRPSKDDWAVVSSRIRASLDYVRYLGPEFKDAPKLRRRAEGFAPPRVAKIVGPLPKPGKAVARRALKRAERATPISEPIRAYLEQLAPDVVLVTPLLEPGTFQTEFLRAANDLGIPTCHCVASWDNLTTKGLIHELPDVITVWNEDQVREAVELHNVPAERVVVTGGVPYDHWFGWSPSRSREEFAAATGLDPKRPFVLYVGSSGFIAPDEAGYIIEWIRALEREGLGDIQVLARPHPVNPLRGDKPSQRELLTLENVVLYPPAGANPTNVEARQDYFDSLYYSSAVAGVNTTAFLEAAIVGRPVFTVLADHYAETQRGVLHFHHLLTAGGGLLNAAESYEDHANDLREALAAHHPEGCVSERSQRFVAAFIRPYGVDEPATPRMLAAIEELGELQKEPGVAISRSLSGRMLSRKVRREIDKEADRRKRAKHAQNRELAERRAAAKATKAAAKASKPTKAEKLAKEKESKTDQGEKDSGRQEAA
ncbi:hypothetical protein AYO39_01975 [Actinobacteria bacterium SCGC AG-212-D09]|nr:hypothetical protein AYO39_01975 [Actinobacteria bacterium SCGC AG-212-D09]